MAPDANEFLSRYQQERLPQLMMGELETNEDGSGFAYDARYSPLVDPSSDRQY